MNIMSCESLYDTGITMQENTLITVNLGNPTEQKLIEDYSTLGKDDELLEILRTFNNSILAVNTKRKTYTVNFDYFDRSKHICEIPFSSLSTGERLFTICHMAHTLKRKIVVCSELGQLDMPQYRLMFKYWGKSPFIDIIIPNDQFEFIITQAYEKYS